MGRTGFLYGLKALYVYSLRPPNPSSRGPGFRVKELRVWAWGAEHLERLS